MPSVTVKEGYLHKHKAEGSQLLSRFAFKKRLFWLTSETLSFAKIPDGQVGTEMAMASGAAACSQTALVIPLSFILMLKEL